MKQTLATLLVVIAISVVEARIGETLDACKAHYEGPTGRVAPDLFQSES
jgi:hypothetical protein